MSSRQLIQQIEEVVVNNPHMRWNADLQKWEGNENETSIFDTENHIVDDSSLQSVKRGK